MDQVKIVELTDNNICKICQNRLGKYTCPKCNILYCSVTCYNSNNHLQCSETFYQNCVMENIKAEGTSEESKRKMMTILQKFNEEYNINENISEDINKDSDDDDETPDLLERMRNIDLDDAEAVWESLTTDEQQEFEALVSSNDITKLLPEWKAWWENQVEEKLVQEMNSDNTCESYIDKCPPVHSKILQFDQISKHKPAEVVKYNLLNVLGAYTYIVRYYNGDHAEFPQEAVYLITFLSKNLESNSCFESYSLALESVNNQALINEWITTDSESKERLYQDVDNITSGPEKKNKNFYILSALSDLYRLLKKSKTGKQMIKQNHNCFSKKFNENILSSDKVVPKEKINTLMRKIDYYLSYVNSTHFEFNF